MRISQHISLTPGEARALRELAEELGRGSMSAAVGVLIARAAAARRGEQGEDEQGDPDGKAEAAGAAAGRGRR